MKYRYIFLLGRPACGKSALYRELKKQILASGRDITFERVDDFPKLWAKMKKDDALEQEGRERIHTRRTDDGGYGITDGDFFNDLLKEVNADLLRIDKPDHMVFVEFARHSYVEAIGNFSDSILHNCFVVYIEVSFDTCWERNVARHEAAKSQNGDDHMIYREAMEEIYLHDDRDAFVQHMNERGIPVSVLNNEAEGKEHLRKQVEELIPRLF